MEILIVSGIFPPDIGGPATYIPRLAESLSAAGETVKVVTLSEQLRKDEVSYLVSRIKRKQLIIKRFTQTVRVLTKEGDKADLILANGLFAEVFQANKRLKKPQINKIVADYAWEVASRRKLTQLDMLGFNQQRSLLFSFWRRLRNYPATQADLLITPSFFLKNVVDSWGYSTPEIQVIPNGFISPPLETLLLEIPQPYLMSIGRLIPFKQFDQLIKLMVELPAEYHLAIVGEGPEKEPLQALIKRLHLENRIHLTGRLSSAQTFALLKKASLFLLFTQGEAFPHTILEAMAASVPVIATNTGGIPEIIISGENGILLSSLDISTLKEMVLNLLTNSSVRQKITTAGQETVQEYSWESCFQRTYELIKKTATPV